MSEATDVESRGKISIFAPVKFKEVNIAFLTYPVCCIKNEDHILGNGILRR